MTRIAEAFQTQRSLTELERGVLRSQRLDSRMPPAAWRKLFQQLASVDRTSRAAVQQLGCFTFLAFAAAVGSCTFAASQKNMERIWPTIFFPVAVLLAVAGIGLVVYGRRFRGTSLSPDVARFHLPLVTLLGHELDTGGVVRLTGSIAPAPPKEDRIALRPPRTSHGPFTNPSHTKWVETWYVQPRGAGEAAVPGGGVLRWRIDDRVRAREISMKVKSPGKTKWKTKHKYRIERRTRVVLRVRADRYLVREGAEAGTGIQVRGTGKRLVLKTSKVIRETNPEAALVLQDLLDVIASLYRQLARRPREARHAGV